MSKLLVKYGKVISKEDAVKWLEATTKRVSSKYVDIEMQGKDYTYISIITNDAAIKRTDIDFFNLFSEDPKVSEVLFQDSLLEERFPTPVERIVSCILHGMTGTEAQEIAVGVGLQMVKDKDTFVTKWIDNEGCLHIVK